MFEIERKFWLHDEQFEAIRSSLEQQFGELEKMHHQADKIFVGPGKTFASHKKGDPLMRLREEDGRNIFTYKRTLLATGNRIENETGVDSPDAVQAILGELGWTLAVAYEKDRREVHGPFFTYALDVVLELPRRYLEIEYVAKADDPESEAKIFAEAERLGIDPDNQVEYRNYAALVTEARENE